MVKKIGTSNPSLKNLIRELKRLSNKEKVNIWRRIAKDLAKPTRIRRRVNIYKIDKYTRNDETAIVPGKVLSLGELNKKITVAAYQFSDAAKKKIPNAITIQQLMKNNPKGKKVRIIG